MPTILVNIGFKRSRWPERPPKKIYPFEWDDFTIDACTCTANSKCDACDLGEAFATRDPRDIVADVYAHEVPCNSLFMNKLAALSLCDARYRRAGATEAFIWVFGRGRQGLEEDFWVYPLLGLVNILSGIHRDNTQQQDAHILRKIYGMCPKIISAIWAVDEGRAFDASRRNEHWRALLMKFVCLVLCDNEVRRTIYNTQIPAIVIECWIRSKSCRDQGMRTPIREAVMYLLWTNDHDMGCPLQLDFLDKIFKAIDVHSIVSTARSILRNKDLSDAALLNEVNVIFRFVLVEHTMPQGKQPFVPVFLEKGVHRWAIAAVHRHVVRNTRGVMYVELLARLGLFIEGILKASTGKVMAVLTDLLSSTLFPEVLVAVLGIMSNTPTGSENMFTIWVQPLLHSLVCTCPDSDRNSCEFHRGRTTAYVDVARAAFARVATATTRRLHKRGMNMTSSPQTQTLAACDRAEAALGIWKALLDLLGINEGVAREQMHKERMCCARECVNANGPEMEGKVKVKSCTACGSVYYCGRRCQKSDWDFHRRECETLRLRRGGTSNR